VSEYGLKVKVEKLETEVRIIRDDFAKFATALLYSGILELTTGADGVEEYKVNKAVLDHNG